MCAHNSCQVTYTFSTYYSQLFCSKFSYVTLRHAHVYLSCILYTSCTATARLMSYVASYSTSSMLLVTAIYLKDNTLTDHVNLFQSSIWEGLPDLYHSILLCIYASIIMANYCMTLKLNGS